MLILGLDEAGRGSVLGPMVVGGFLVASEDLELLRATGVKDSKLLSRARREELLPGLLRLGQGRVEVISAEQIDENNLTKLEIEAFAAIIHETRPDEVMIDAPVHPRAIPSFLKELRSRLDRIPTILAEPKADLHYPYVGAASVFAKTCRDEAIRRLGDVGSGYPSDPKTRALVAALARGGAPLPTWVRSRWGTVRQLRQQGLFE
jgi:ribonuclease HII